MNYDIIQYSRRLPSTDIPLRILSSYFQALLCWIPKVYRLTPYHLLFTGWTYLSASPNIESIFLGFSWSFVSVEKNEKAGCLFPYYIYVLLFCLIFFGKIFSRSDRTTAGVKWCCVYSFLVLLLSGLVRGGLSEWQCKGNCFWNWMIDITGWKASAGWGTGGMS